MKQHTPTPWKVEVNERFRVEHGDIFPVKGATGRPVCVVPGQIGDEDSANAAFIVQACNSHAALVEALEAVNSMDLTKAPSHALVSKVRAALKLAGA